jgi:hypothetical protein
MLRRSACLVLLLALPATALAYPPVPNSVSPDALLSAGTILYFRHDGIEPHRKAYDQTAFAEMMRGDMGDFLKYMMKLFQEQLLPDMLRKGNFDPAKEKLITQAVGNIPAILSYFGDQGIVIGLEASDFLKPQFQLTLVFPNGGQKANAELLTGTIATICTIADIKVREQRIEDRNVYTPVFPEHIPIKVAWWVEGNHLVFTVGTEKPEHTINLVKDGGVNRGNITAMPLYRETINFKAYETSARGFIDLKGLLAVLRKLGPEAQKIVDDLGLAGLQSLTFQFGYEGKAQRSTFSLNLAPELKGLLALVGTPRPLDLKELPGVPPDATTVSMSRFDLATLYDAALLTTEVIVRTFYPQDEPKLRDGLKELQQMLGVDIRKDLLGALDSTCVIYSAPSEGPFNLGLAFAFKVKDEKKLNDSLTTLFKNLKDNVGINTQVRKRAYRGGEIHTVTFFEGGRPLPITPAYTIHKGWFVVGIFPQTVQGWVLRNSGGNYSTWKPSPLLAKAVADAQKNPNVKLLGVTQLDPRKSMNTIFSLAPLIGSLAYMGTEGRFDNAMLPATQSVTEPLFPNVSLLVQEGTTFRYESYSSVFMPIDISGVEMVIPFAWFMFGRFGF